MTGSCLTDKDGGVLLKVRVKPRSSRERIEGVSPAGELVVRLTAAPVDNQANQALIALIAKTLRVPKSAVTVAAGAKGRSKTLLIAGADPAAAAALLFPSPD